MNGEYASYLRREWQNYASDPARGLASLHAAGRPELVLDVGCGAGQELLPFVTAGSRGVGVDVTSDAPAVGRRLFQQSGHATRVVFVRSAAERLPFRASSFDVVVCRLALPYTDNRRALGEIARVLRPGGTLLLKIHHALYYVSKLCHGVLHANLPSAVHAARVLASGTLYHLTGSQWRNRVLTGETFQTHWLLKRELVRHGLVISGDMPDSSPRAPAFVVRKG